VGFFPPEVFADARAVLSWRRRARQRQGGCAGLIWLWLLLLLYPFTDYMVAPLEDWGASEAVAAAAFVILDSAFNVAVFLARRDAAGARFFGALVLVLNLSYAATQILREGTPEEQLVYDVLYTVLLVWVLAHVFRDERMGRLLTAPIVIGAFVGYLAFTIPGFISQAELEHLLNSDDGVTYYNAAASVIPVFLIALSLEGGWLSDFDDESEVARALSHQLRLVTLLVLAIAQAAAIGAMLAGGGSPLAYQITVQAMAVGFTAIFIMLQVHQARSQP
jgi:hypothetical protein